MTSGSWWAFALAFSAAWLFVGFAACDMYSWLRRSQRARAYRLIERIGAYSR